MPKTLILPASLVLALLAGAAAQAATLAPPAHHPQAMDQAAVAQWAAEDGISLQQAEGMTLSQLATLKNQRDGDDGSYSRTLSPMPHSMPM